MSTTQRNHSTDLLGDMDPFPAEFAIITLIYALTFLLGVPGNGLVIWVTGFKMKWTVNTVWFLNLALADLLCCLSLPFSIANLALGGHWPYGAVLCKVLPSAVILNMFASVFLLVAISADRCLLVIKPIWSQNHRRVVLALMLCLGIWCLAFLMCVPVFLYREITHSDGKITCVYNYYSNLDLDYSYWDEDYGLSADYSNLDHTTMMPSLPTGAPEDVSGYSPVGGSPINFGLTTVEPHERFTISGPSARIYVIPLDHGQLGDLQSFKATNEPGDASNFYPSRISMSSQDFDSVYPDGMFATTILIPKTNSSVWPRDYIFENQDLPVALKTTTFTRAIFGFLVPFLIILICYARITWKVKGARFAKSHGKTLRVVFSIVLAFFLCWIPYHVVGILTLYVRSPTLDWLDHMSQALASANSCVNPLLYVFTGQDFKEKIRKSLHGIFESAFSEEVTRSSAPSRSKTRSSMDANINSTII
ncbi:C3a anaphylatoxin chemotactic receptor [Rhinatrema bivittatum]|uniref:C3a anaphylatoxin chemotactic receptor n=1 Tax=Rhinatrema bivittatum TaxID=194408 RepID=UPI00112C5FD7|nr:C3a anaphylatoxin chemotactic receptor [Rhinatrema bivittatum]XP_029437644.1 C3a anaphylatoxin chemotactic receptor [Rhinatrema bivittatum]